MDQNRRRFLRKVPDDLAVIQIERDEVGKVLNISEGGLSFSSITPVPRNLPVYFWFSFDLRDRIEAMGEVTWTDISRTIGGLRFTQISQAGRDQIRKWLTRLRSEEAPRELPEEIEIELDEFPGEPEQPTPQLVAVGGPLPVRPNPPAPPAANGNGLDRVARFISKARAFRPVLPIRRTAAVASKPVLSAPPAPSASPVLSAPPALSAPPVLSAPLAPSAPLASAPTLASELQTLASKEPAKSRSYKSMFSLDATPAKPLESSDLKLPSLAFRGLESLVELVPLQRYLSAKKRQLLCGILLGIGLSALVMLPAIKFWNARTHADMKPVSTVSTEPASLKDNAAIQSSTTAATTPVTPPVAKPSYPATNIFSDSAPIQFKKGSTTNVSAKSRLADLSRADPPKSVALKAAKQTSAAPGQKVLASQKAMASLKPIDSNPSTSTKSGMTIGELWKEVQAGNAKAATELAEYYIKGDGVPKNCQQARVLLLVASEKRNTAAIKRLQQLDKDSTSCP